MKPSLVGARAKIMRRRNESDCDVFASTTSPGSFQHGSKGSTRPAFLSLVVLQARVWMTMAMETEGGHHPIHHRRSKPTFCRVCFALVVSWRE